MLKQHQLATWNSEKDYWEQPQQDIFGHSVAYSGTLPTSGTTQNGALYARPTLVPRTDGNESSCSESAETQLLPTVTAQDGANNAGPSQFERNSMPLNVVAYQMACNSGLGGARLLPTPMTSDCIGAGPADMRRNSPQLRAINNLLPTPNTMDSLPRREGEARERQLRRGEGPNASRRSNMGNLREDVPIDGAWGRYEAAIRRWEQHHGPAPAPTEPTGKDGKQQLSARFVEWMMGLPAGHVTGVEGIPRTQQLKMLGNGVVPQQAAHALKTLLERQANKEIT